MTTTGIIAIVTEIAIGIMKVIEAAIGSTTATIAITAANPQQQPIGRPAAPGQHLTNATEIATSW
jgi:hypothetical protein